MAIATQVLANRKTKITDSCATRIFAFPRKKKRMKPGFNFKCPHDEFAHVHSKASEQILSLAELAFC